MAGKTITIDLPESISTRFQDAVAVTFGYATEIPKKGWVFDEKKPEITHPPMEPNPQSKLEFAIEVIKISFIKETIARYENNLERRENAKKKKEELDSII